MDARPTTKSVKISRYTVVFLTGYLHVMHTYINTYMEVATMNTLWSM